MAVYKRGRTWWYSFVFKGERIQESTKQGNQRVAEQIEATHKTRLAKGEVGNVGRKAAPTLREFSDDFLAAMEEAGPTASTVEFYRSKLKPILAYAPLADAGLDKIDEELIEDYVRKRCRGLSRRGRRLSPASINRELATLRRVLRYAQRKRKLILSVSAIELRDGEIGREFVLTR